MGRALRVRQHGYIVRSLWGLPFVAKAGSNIDTIARFGAVVLETTFPTVVNEVVDALNKEDILEVVKSSVESPIFQSFLIASRCDKKRVFTNI